MAHLIDQMAFVGQTPWHGLGAKLEENEPLDLWRTRAGLGWEAKTSPVRYAYESIDLLTGERKREARTAEGLNVIYRSDTGKALATVSDGYRIVQPAEVIEFYRDLTESHGFKMETAGSLKEGRVIWALARADAEAMRICGNDAIGGYLLLSTSFDGSAATTGRFTTVRVVCNNTLTAATANGKAPVNVSHRAMFDANAAKVTLQVGDAFTKFQEEAQRMAESGVNTSQAIDFFLNVYHGITAGGVTDENRKATDKTIARLSRHFIAGPGADLRSARGTVWGLLNAVTFDLDHACRAHSPENRFASAQFGRGETIKEKARELALALAA
jgi:phage/plasmid-like protein (TIGR03299 family)